MVSNFIGFISPFSPPIQDRGVVRPETSVVDRSWKQTFVTKQKKNKEKGKAYLETNLLKPRHMWKANILLFYLRPPNSVPELEF